jgi:hypothetical protein
MKIIVTASIQKTDGSLVEGSKFQMYHPEPWTLDSDMYLGYLRTHAETFGLVETGKTRSIGGAICPENEFVKFDFSLMSQEDMPEGDYTVGIIPTWPA